MSYSNPVTAVYRFPAAALSSAAVVGRIISPSGMAGRIIDVGHIVTTGVTVAASSVTVGTSADPDAYATHSVPVSSAGAGGNGATIVQNHEITADSVIEVATGGEATAGAGDLLVTVAWY
jgi:hypothetical protein